MGTAVEGNSLGRMQYLKKVLAPKMVTVTASGLVVLLATLVIGGLAIYYTNNLFYLLVAMLLGFVSLSGILSEWTIRGLEASRSLPRKMVAGEPCQVAVRIKNKKSIMPSFCLRVTDHAPRKEVFFVKVDAGEVAELRYCLTPLHRGVHRWDALEVTTRFPFGFFLKRSLFRKAEEALVYPSIRPVDRPFRSLGLGSDHLHRAFRGEGTELYSVRDYREGDSSRNIHWKSTARLKQVMIKELEKEVTGVVTLELRPPFGPYLEEAVALAASLAYRVYQRAIELRIRTGAVETAFGASLGHLEEILALLALYSPGDEPGTMDVGTPHSEEHLIVLVGPESTWAPCRRGEEVVRVGPEWSWLLPQPEGDLQAGTSEDVEADPHRRVASVSGVARS